MPDDLRIRGSINAVLNGLIDEGLLAGFQFEWDAATREKVHIVIVPGSATNGEVALEVVRRGLARFADRVTMSVEAG